jgi:hypothetical protein
MDPSVAQLRAVLLIVGCSLAVVVAVVVRLVRSGRAVQFPDVAGQDPHSRPRPDDRVSTL